MVGWGDTLEYNDNKKTHFRGENVSGSRGRGYFVV